MKFKTSTIRSKAKQLAFRRHTSTIYVPVDDNIYFDGISYRVRVTRNNVRSSKNFKSAIKAVKYRNELKRV